MQRGFPAGVTTNPAILSKEERRDFREHINDMIAVLKKYDCQIPLSVEVFTAVAIWYLLLTTIWSAIQFLIERRLGASERDEGDSLWSRLAGGSGQRLRRTARA